MFHKDIWANALRLAKRRDEILEKNPDMPVVEALNKAYEELKKDGS